MKRIITGILISLMTLSCRTEAPQTQLTDKERVYSAILNNPPGEEQLWKTVREHRIIFLTENHSRVDPLLFLAENLQRFFDAGVRHLVLEGELSPLPEDANYYFRSFYPWSNAGHKYEWNMLTQAVREINTTSEEKLRIHYGEEGFVFNKEWSPKVIPELLNGRDKKAWENISSLAETTPEQEKILIFYGGSHGIKKVLKNIIRHNSPPFDHKPLGAWLKEYYPEDFISIRYSSYYHFYSSEFYRGEREDRRVFLTDREFYQRGEYDYHLVDLCPDFGVFNQYLPSDENLRYLFVMLKKFAESDIKKWDKERYLRHEARGSFLSALYYMKLWMGDRFDYTFWNSDKTLKQALDELEQSVFYKDSHPSDYLALPEKEIRDLRYYHSLMFTTRIENFRKDDIWMQKSLIRNMSMAKTIFPEDLWSTYWMARGYMLKGQYEEALPVWEELLNNPRSLSMENLPAICDLAADCAANLELREKEDSFRALKNSLTNEFDMKIKTPSDLLFSFELK